MNWTGRPATKEQKEASAAKSRAQEGLAAAARKGADPTSLQGTVGQRQQRKKRTTSAFKGVSETEAEEMKRYKEALIRNAHGARGGRWRGSPSHDEL